MAPGLRAGFGLGGVFLGWADRVGVSDGVRLVPRPAGSLPFARPSLPLYGISRSMTFSRDRVLYPGTIWPSTSRRASRRMSLSRTGR